MAIYTASSRYELTNNGQLAAPKTQDSTSYYQYISREGDSFERIAARLFNNGTRYWEIAQLNPHVYFPGDIPVGTVLRIPR